MADEALHTKKCVPCEGGVSPLDQAAATEYLGQVSDWELGDAAKKISKKFSFADFKVAMQFVQSVADIAEEEGHHPDIHIHYNTVILELATHAIGGLSENDFILAAKIDQLGA